jgi:hypothetical protein
MKTLLTLITICIASTFTLAQNNTSYPNINGVWADSNSTVFTNCYLIIAQDGAKTNMTHYLEFNGTPMVETGVGTYIDGKVFFEVKVTKPIPGWATTGKHYLTISADGKTLRGEYQDAKGNKGPLVFKRILK